MIKIVKIVSRFWRSRHQDCVKILEIQRNRERNKKTEKLGETEKLKERERERETFHLINSACGFGV